MLRLRELKVADLPFSGCRIAIWGMTGEKSNDRKLKSALHFFVFR